MTAFLALCTAAAAGLLFWGFQVHNAEVATAGRGVIVASHIVSVDHANHGRTLTDFTTRDGQHLTNIHVFDVGYPSPDVGQSLMVEYDPLDPAADVHDARRPYDTWSNAETLIVLAAGVFITGLVFWWRAEAARRRYKHTRRHRTTSR